MRIGTKMENNSLDGVSQTPKKSKKKRNILLGIGITLCLAGAGERIYSYYVTYYPLAREGECLKIPNLKSPGQSLTGQVTKNESTTGETTLVLDVPMGGMVFQVPVKARNMDLRTVGAEKVDCGYQEEGDEEAK